ncbi:hypothetical protein A2331_03570 [Candidatus Falkowbacteria bacterium RIFOXYB2_FULL_34_18]|uniref:Bacterial type II secretion system protein E domain-containing protein n=1 Tax=Candidatus Falkowbacteria bacterium RIFOXYD2_FULL_34_120 TaxID=1798007 RepID=A0A1F5TSP6_9BACT|nr:MAG: hypothetical protein A2331_03570 [Candidatus Falkowbacteria bacterium RIFOXYB2_FULL_34_18]OGF30100.1 MAG: hypothetical protein A2500_04880 [Candidatus Falkowbacteria bacterium RIFOXYC12_FULL_34_55]OGF37566.1 MAG: hypothetical protein A2466_01965 [Candidatus Falkowbacteria bacterium RIFOXYC2_FULL_34_220]OGF39322.1 MAG: hypothetical protein A2515_02380 [Candidatus Falkowbacteria bacterium RIFOXYD12_FULL_34_57]OGF41827.1 MAG: hypothetical protein A2531_05365 [Candidatus Falkowbacteria bact
MKISNLKLKSILVDPGHISEKDFNQAMNLSNEKNISIEDILLDRGLINDGQLGHIIAEFIGVPYVNLRKEKIDDMVLNLIPEIIAKSKKIIIFYEDENEIKVGMMDPQDLEIIHILEKKFNRQIIPYYITKNDFLENLSRYNVGIDEEASSVLAKLQDNNLDMDEKNKANVRMVELLLEHGHYSKASDIHIEPYKKIVIVRFRIDGVLHDVLEIPKNLLSLIISRIKILSKMRIDEHFAAQDGKFQFKVKNDQIDVRVSIVPITEGENVVMRLLSTKSRKMDLDSLGLDSADLDKIKKAIKSPHGMILVTGPTGSGKTTTIYEFLKILNTKEIHIATIEDPVEYDIEGISQIQVNKKTNLTFANGLRAIVRQDPDIIMIGEIRDHETADIAVNSGLTGHLVLSTLHANDAATTLPRLLDMGIEPYLIASTVRVVIAQRLLRKICEKCRTSYELPENEMIIVRNNKKLKEIFNIKEGEDKKITLYKGSGCKVCAHTGYSGRIGIFEVLENRENIKELIIKRASSSEISKMARANGMTTMFEDGIQKVIQGITTLEEVLRVAEIV